MKAGTCLLGLVLLAGCLGQGRENEGPYVPSVPLEAGHWVLARSGDNGRGFYEFDMEGGLYGGAGDTIVSDSFACLAIQAEQGWTMDQIYRRPGTIYAGSGQPRPLWAGISYASFELAQIPGSILGPIGDRPVLFGWDLIGSQLIGNANVTSEFGVSVVDKGRFWCLDGPSRFDGAYQVTQAYFEGQGLRWSAKFERGILLRLRGSVGPETLEAHVEGVGQSFPLPPEAFAEGGLDATFCHPQATEWSLVLDDVGALLGSWQLAAFVFDVDGIECPEGWSASDLTLTGD